MKSPKEVINDQLDIIDHALDATNRAIESDFEQSGFYDILSQASLVNRWLLNRKNEIIQTGKSLPDPVMTLISKAGERFRE